MYRRNFLATALYSGTTILAGMRSFAGFADTLSVAPVTPQNLSFTVLRDREDVIGYHRLYFQRNDTELRVDIAINLEVMFGPITVFSYQHQNQEIWRESLLYSLQTRTNDNGTIYEVEGMKQGEFFHVRGEQGDLVLPSDIMPTSYWQRESVNRQALLDTQYGIVRQVAANELGRQVIPFGDGETPANGYRVNGELEMDIWYLDNDQWAGLSFINRDSEISYLRDTLAT